MDCANILPINLSADEQLSELNKHIIGQNEAKRSLIRLTNCADMRLAVRGEIKEVIRPFHAIFYGPTGSGKSALVECHAKNKKRPYIKTEATRYTEVGYVGRDVESMVRDLVEAARTMVKEEAKKYYMEKAHKEAVSRIVDVLVGDSASEETRKIFINKVIDHDVDEREIEIEIEVKESHNVPPIDMGGAQIGIMNISDMLNKTFGKKSTKIIITTVREALGILTEEALSDCIDEDKITREAMALAENRGIIFIDEIDKIASRSEVRGGEVNKEGVQRDLLPIVDGTVVHTKYGQFRTHHVLFIAAGAFHSAKLSDLLPELQGRFPVRVKLNPLTYDDLVSILRDTKYSLLKQYTAMLAVEDVQLSFTETGIAAIAEVTVAMNRQENTGARRLRSVIDRVLNAITFDPRRFSGKIVSVDAKFVNEGVVDIMTELDLSKFVL